MNFVSFFLILSFLKTAHLHENNVQLKIKQGFLNGTFRTTWGGKSFFAFQGIPYALPPVGERRFQPPSPLTVWKGILDATKSHESCPQRDIIMHNLTIYGNEDCLFLNVYTPQITDKHLLPVIAFIHGGGFMTGNANLDLYGPDIMLDKDIVMVTFNYRIGALGFLSLEDEILPGNNGLKDQTLALRWIKDNIKHFGGNPNKVTIFGNSAGGASVYYHLLSPLSKGLFHAAISSSGIATAPWAIAQRGEAKQNAIKLAKFLNCSTTSSTLILTCLQNTNAYNIVRQNDRFMEINYDPSIPHKPVVELKMRGAFLTEHPFDVIMSEKLFQVPYINGITTNDGGFKSASYYNNYALVKQLNTHFNYFSPMVFNLDRINLKNESIEAVRQFYFGNNTIDNNTKTQLTDVITDTLFYYPQRVTSHLHAKYSSKPVYFYLFGYKGSIRSSKLFGDPEHDYGVVHADDLIYSLSNLIYKNYVPTEADLKMNNIMTTLLYNFARTGNPTPEDSSLKFAEWKPLQSNKFRYYSITGPNNLTMEDTLYEERYKFWEKLNIFPKLVNVRDEL